MPFPPSEALFDAQRTIISADAAAYHADHLRERAHEIGADVLTRLRAGEAITGPQDAAARRLRAELRREVAEAARLTALTSPFNLTGLPAISVPCGFTAAGLPIGLQIASGPWREAAVLRVARAYEGATAWAARRPAIALSA